MPTRNRPINPFAAALGDIFGEIEIAFTIKAGAIKHVVRLPGSSIPRLQRIKRFAHQRGSKMEIQFWTYPDNPRRCEWFVDNDGLVHQVASTKIVVESKPAPAAAA
jgi:hypothetical protein